MYGSRVIADSGELFWFGIIGVLGVEDGFGRPDLDMGICFLLVLGHLDIPFPFAYLLLL